jgi:methylenetetrahydrofolate dehydrogenase (NADP+)/methenyltetrahydrofolate cyclohydrolase
MATIIDGRAAAAAVREQVKAEVAAFAAETGHTPGLATVLVGEDPASQVYVRNKREQSAAVGMTSSTSRSRRRRRRMSCWRRSTD